MIHERAGLPALDSDLVDVARLITAYYSDQPDPARSTSGSASARRATAARACDARSTRTTSPPPARRSVDYRGAQGIAGPLFLGRDTHGLSEAGVDHGAGGLRRQRRRRLIDCRDGYTPTPAVSHAILTLQPRAATDRAGRRRRRHPVAQPARGRRVQVQPAGRRTGRHRHHRLDPGPRQRVSSPTGWPGSSGSRCARPRWPPTRPGATTTWRLRRRPAQRGRPRRRSATPASASARTRWAARRWTTGATIAEPHGLDLTVVNPKVDPTWRFMTLDWDGKIRMDCSCPFAMASLIDAQGPVPTSPPATTPTPTGTAS